MIDHGIRHPHYRLLVVPAVLSLASASWQREVWLDPAQPENLDHVIRVLCDGFRDADDPQRLRVPKTGASGDDQRLWR